MFKKIKSGIIAIVVFILYRIWSLTWRRSLHPNLELEADIKSGLPIIFAFWHGHELAMISYADHYRFATMTSVSDDGQLMAKVLGWLGAKTSKGSSSKKAIQGLKGLIRLAKSGYIPVIPVDGPRGPIYKAKPGVFELSKILNAKIYPGGVATTSKISFEKSWNKTFLPHPFARVHLVWGKPLRALSKSDDPRTVELAEKLESAINAAGQLAAEELHRIS